MIGCQSYPFVLFVRSVVKTSSSSSQAPRRNAHASRYGKSFTPTSLFTLLTSLPLPLAEASLREILFFPTY